MRRERRKEVIVIREDSAVVFQERVNDELTRLAHEDIEPELTITTDPLTAVMVFTRTDYIAESETDKKALKGHKVLCRNCAYFEYGTDRRIGYCNLKCKQVYTERFACKHIKDGEEDD